MRRLSTILKTFPTRFRTAVPIPCSAYIEFISTPDYDWNIRNEKLQSHFHDVRDCLSAMKRKNLYENADLQLIIKDIDFLIRAGS